MTDAGDGGGGGAADGPLTLAVVQLLPLGHPGDRPANHPADHPPPPSPRPPAC